MSMHSKESDEDSLAGTSSTGGSEEESRSDESGSDSDEDYWSDDDEDDSTDSSRGTGEETEEDHEEKQAAGKREDFEKMRELSAHMDNIVQRLSKFFPQVEIDDPPRAVPELPSLPVPQNEPRKEARDRGVSARTMTMDRAVSARRLTTDRAVSVASGLHFGDGLSDSMGSVTLGVDPTENPRANQRKPPKHNGVERPWAQGEEDAEMRVGKRVNARGAPCGQEADGTASENKGNGTHRRQSAGDGNGSRNDANVSRPSYGLEGVHERLLWDELRESLAGVAVGRKGLLPCGQDGVRAFEKTIRGQAGEEQRRRLIDEAISVLLEASSDEEGVEQGSL